MMDDVYVLLVEHSSTYSVTDTHICSVFSSEKKAWEQVEERYETLIKVISKSSSADIWFAEFRGKRFILSYHTPYNGEVHVIKYIIDKRTVF